MNRKPSRTFVYLALMMVFLLVIGLIVVGVGIMVSSTPTPFELTRDSIISQNIVEDANPLGTETFQAAQRPTETAKAAFTPIYYTADMSPTALPRFTGTPTPPYDAELFQKRRMEELGLITGSGPTQYAIFYATETALVEAYQTAQNFTATPTVTLTLTLSPTALATNNGSGITQCAYAWAHRDIPDVTALSQNALSSANLSYTMIRADAYGEDCIDMNTNTVVSFGAMTTDFYLTVEVSNVSDSGKIADYVVDVYGVLSDLPRVSLPARLGYLDITFTSGTETKRLRATFDEIKVVLDKNLSGGKLLDELGGLR